MSIGSPDTIAGTIIITQDGTKFEALSEEALADVSGSACPFTTIPATMDIVLVTIRAFPVVVRLDGNAATTSNGADFGVNASVPYEWHMDATQAALVRMIQNGGTATGWVIYGKKVA